MSTTSEPRTMSKQRKALSQTRVSIPVSPDPLEYAERLSAALSLARDNFSAETTSPIHLSERVCKAIPWSSPGMLRGLLAPAADRRYDFIHIQTTPDTRLMDEYNLSATYDTIISRKHFHFDVYRSVTKLNAAESLIRQAGLTITTSLQEAHLIVLFSYLKQKPQSYENHFNNEAIVAGPDPDDPNEKVWIDNGNPFYERFGDPPALPPWPIPLTPGTTSPAPSIIRLINEDYVIQAFKMLTAKETMFVVSGGEDGLDDRVAIARFEDRVGKDGTLEYGTDVFYLPELPPKKQEEPPAEVPVAKGRKGGSGRADSASVVASGEDGPAKKRQRKK